MYSTNSSEIALSHVVSTSPLVLADFSVQAGFPSPAEDYSTKSVDIADLLMEHPQACFLMKVRGYSMRDEGIEDGDFIVVDRAIKARHGHIVVAIIDSEFTLKKLFNAGGHMRLKAGNATYPDIVPKDGQTVEIFGVMKGIIRLYA